MHRRYDISKIKAIVKRKTGFCPVCGSVLAYNMRTGRNGQWAHVISNTQTNRKIYGSDVVGSRFNGALVCSLKCNNSIQMKRASPRLGCGEFAEWVREQNKSHGQ